MHKIKTTKIQREVGREILMAEVLVLLSELMAEKNKNNEHQNNTISKIELVSVYSDAE